MSARSGAAPARASYDRRLYRASLAFAAAPVVAALAHALAHPFDLALLPLAVVTFLVTGITVAGGRIRRRRGAALALLALAAGVLGAAAAYGTALAVGGAELARSPAGVAAALLFSGSWSVSHLLDALARPQLR